MTTMQTGCSDEIRPAGKELALVVPSVIVPQEKNFVLNVRHSQFGRMQVGKPQPFSLDERLWAPAEASQVTVP